MPLISRYFLFSFILLNIGGSGCDRWIPLTLDDIESDYMVELANYTVDEQNIKKKTNLVFKQLFSGFKQADSGLEYALFEEATDYGNCTTAVRNSCASHKKIGGSGCDRWIPLTLDDIESDYMVELANYTVDEHNIKKKTNLVFKQLFSGFKQAESGLEYALFEEATDYGNCTTAVRNSCGVDGNYTAVVKVLEWYTQLVSFTKNKRMRLEVW
ncbi:cysteine proteinase inhibitor 5 [Striga asiatica]|uniref:Cysteine proteinase inhibitor 5 n=1 Tax=Striga asiatica TaxID=4170 RepID=A0A5A7QGE8_STRAF|nr:cysteine proteinase inhibitor 5 [Striga asiatica]